MSPRTDAGRVRPPDQTERRLLSDPIGPIAHAAAAPVAGAAPRAMPVSDLPEDSPVARAHASIERARAFGAEAERTVAAMRSGASNDVEGVLLATRQADAAFRMLEAARNAMLEAYARMDEPR